MTNVSNISGVITKVKLNLLRIISYVFQLMLIVIVTAKLGILECFQ